MLTLTILFSSKSNRGSRSNNNNSNGSPRPPRPLTMPGRRLGGLQRGPLRALHRLVWVLAHPIHLLPTEYIQAQPAALTKHFHDRLRVFLALRIPLPRHRPASLTIPIAQARILDLRPPLFRRHHRAKAIQRSKPRLNRLASHTILLMIRLLLSLRLTLPKLLLPLWLPHLRRRPVSGNRRSEK